MSSKKTFPDQTEEVLSGATQDSLEVLFSRLAQIEYQSFLASKVDADHNDPLDISPSSIKTP